MIALGHDVRPWYDHYPGERDVDWLPHIGAQHWVLLTKDAHIRRRPLEVRAILTAKVRAFILTATNLRGEEQAEIFARTMRKIYGHCQQRGPFVCTISRTRLITQISGRALSRRARTADDPR